MNALAIPLQFVFLPKHYCLLKNHHRVVSYFSTELQKAIDLEFDSSQLALARASGISQSVISRQCQGKYVPDSETLLRLTAVLSPSGATSLVVAFLRDQCPREYRGTIAIKAGKQHASNDSMKENLLDLSSHTERSKELLRKLSEEMTKDPLLIDLLAAMIRFSRPR